jgi:hypothetical protein
VSPPVLDSTKISKNYYLLRQAKSSAEKPTIQSSLADETFSMLNLQYGKSNGKSIKMCIELKSYQKNTKVMFRF